MKNKLGAKTVFLYATYVAMCLISGNVMDGNLTFGVYIGAIYSTNPIIATLLYLCSAVAYGWQNLIQAGVRAVVMLIFVGVHRLARKKIGKSHLLLYTVLANVFYCAYGFENYANLFDKLLYSGCGIAFCYVCVYVFRAVFVRGLAYRPALDERVCIALFTVVASYCLSTLSVAGLSAIYFVLPFALLTCAFCFGDATTLVCGVLVGIGAVLATGQYQGCVFATVAALASVTMCKVNRYLGALGVVVVDVIMSYFWDLHGAFTTLVFAPTLSSVFVFIVVPTSVFVRLKDYCCGGAERYLAQSVMQTIGEGLSRRLYRLSDIFLSMKNAFFSMSVGQVSQEDAQKAIVKQCAESVCRDCQQRANCWRQNIVNTEKALLNLTNCAVKRGKCTILDVPQTLSVKCDKMSAMLAEVNAQAQTYRQYAERAQQADSGKLLLGEQMGGVSHLLTRLAVDCKSNTLYDKDKEQDLVDGLVFHNVLCVGATIAQQADMLVVVATVAKKDADSDVIAKVTSGVIKQPMVVDRLEATPSPSWVNVHLVAKPRFDIEFGVSSMAKDGSSISGDTHSVVRTDNGKCIVALVDGMGSGNKAEQMSATSINLVESFYRAGFDNDVILSCVNKLLSASGNEVFCAVDLVVVDLYNGLADFIKLGACVGLVKCANSVQIVSGSSLPLGVLEQMTPSITKKALNSGDVAVLVSDGVADCFDSPNALAAAFNEVSLAVPQSIAHSLLQKALKNNKNKASDDMTVVVAKVV